MTTDPTPARLSIYDAAAANRWRTLLLIAAFTALVALLAYFVGEYFAPGGGVAALPFVFAISIGGALVSYFAGDKLILAQSQARELGASEEPQLRNIVEALALGLGIPTPKIYVIEDSAPNAFATGRDPQHASIAVTRGLLDKLDRTELEGVIAHELSHVGNRDIRVMVLVTVLVGTVALLADWMWRSMFWGRGRDRDRGGAGAIIAVIAIALAVLTPIIATLIQLAVSRQREYLADASGALLTRYPPG
ncbi:MAG TPA: M48 family metalloprotease, partial [Candidatus Limnocylindria bacterium]|nr:M48 family metalloprotease [Candidatus Limnocylindria bacterium]